MFTSDTLFFTFLLSFILAELLVSGYKLIFSNQPEPLFYICSLLLSFIASIIFPIFQQNIIVLAGLVFYSNISSYLSQFFLLEDQLEIFSSSKYIKRQNWFLYTKRGLFFNQYEIHYSTTLGFMTHFDKHNLFDIIKNHKGSIIFNDEVSISFNLKAVTFKLISQAKKEGLIETTQDIDNIIHNILIDK